MRYDLLPEARLDLKRLHAFLDEKNPDAANRAMLAIDEGLLRLLDNPLMGRPVGDGSPLRCLVIRFGEGAYIANYRIENEIPTITRLWHSREDRGTP